MTCHEPQTDWYSDQDLERKKIWYSAAASAYDRTRPRYAAVLVERAISLAGLAPGARILEVGCGPATATVAFAQAGFAMLCLEANAEMCRLARTRCAGFASVEIQHTAFEEWAIASEAFDAVLAATAFNWIAAGNGMARVHAALRPAGSLILLWNTGLQPQLAVHQILQPVYERFAPAPGRFISQAAQLESLKQVEQSLVASGLFEAPTGEWTICETVYSLEDYLLLLSTYSPYIGLEAATRDALFEGLAATIARDLGGKIDLWYLSGLQVARRRFTAPT